MTKTVSLDEHLLVPGRFDPLHYGHLRMAEEAARLSGRSPTFVLDIDSPSDVVSQFTGSVMLLSGDRSLVGLAERFPGSHIAVGATRLASELTDRVVDRLTFFGVVLWVSPRIWPGVWPKTGMRLSDVLTAKVSDGSVTRPPTSFYALSELHDVTSDEIRAARKTVAGRR